VGTYLKHFNFTQNIGREFRVLVLGKRYLCIFLFSQNVRILFRIHFRILLLWDTLECFLEYSILILYIVIIFKFIYYILFINIIII